MIYKQIDYYAFVPEKQPCNHNQLLQLAASEQYFIQLTPIPTNKSITDKSYINLNSIQLTNIGDLKLNTIDNDGIFSELYDTVHLQYIRTLIRERENVLANEIEKLECQIVTNKYHQALSIAQYDGW